MKQVRYLYNVVKKKGMEKKIYVASEKERARIRRLIAEALKNPL